MAEAELAPKFAPFFGMVRLSVPDIVCGFYIADKMGRGELHLL